MKILWFNYLPSCCSKTFIHLRGTNEDIFDEIRELSVTLRRVTEMQVKCFMAQKGSKDIIKLVHVTSVVQP